VQSAAEGERGIPLEPRMTARDLTLFLIVAVLALRWIAVAAAAGPSSLVVWLVTATLLFAPLVVCVLELGRRYPEEGGLYAWVKRAFGEYPAFVTGWTYWASNLPYFPGLLYFAAGNVLLALPGGARFSDSGIHVAGIALLGLSLAVVPNLLGIGRGKWVQNIGALAYWIPGAALILLGTAAFLMYGSETPITPDTLVPEFGLNHALAWSTIAFAFGGVETASLVVTQVRDPRRTIPRAVITAGTVILVTYVLGTLALLWALPVGEISQIGGFSQAMQALGVRAGVDGLGRTTAALLAIGGIGGVGAWITATARLPYVAGIEHYVPQRFGTLHPKYRTPHVAILTQAGIAALLILIGQAGTTVRGAYDMLVAMSVISYFIPLLLMFAAAYRLAGVGPVAETLVSPRVMRTLAALGFAVIATGTLLALVPSAGEARPGLAIAKLVVLTALLVAAGSGLYLRVAWRRAAGGG
jgi:amino acid transporter